MNYNQRNDYRVSHEIALGWWKAMPTGHFLVQGLNSDVQPVSPADDKCEPNGPWVIVTPRYSLLAAVVTQPLKDGSGQWGLAVLWYNREKCSLFWRLLRRFKLSRSKAAAMMVEETVLRQGGVAFPCSHQTMERT